MSTFIAFNAIIECYLVEDPLFSNRWEQLPTKNLRRPKKVTNGDKNKVIQLARKYPEKKSKLLLSEINLDICFHQLIPEKAHQKITFPCIN